MTIYAVIDTNVIVAALLTKHEDSATRQVLRAMVNGRITPLYHKDILAEYDEVLHRPKYHQDDDMIKRFIATVRQYGVEVFPKPSGEVFVDVDDLIFYEVALEKREENAYLVTGNQKHYPIKDFIVTPAEMVQILKGNS